VAINPRHQPTETPWEPVYVRTAARALRPKERLTFPEWLERYHHIPKEAAEPGRFRFEKTPWLRGIAEVLDPAHPAQEIVFRKPTQIGATELGNGWIGYCIERHPCMILQVQPTLEMAKRYSRTKISPMIRSNPLLKGLVAAEKSRDGANTILGKTFPGGAFFMTGANSAAGLRMVSARILFTDERTSYPVDLDEEGNPFLIAKKRTDTFGRKAKIYSPSTPTIKGECVIDDEYERSDKRQFFIPCPRCGEHQTMVWSQVKWPTGRPDLAGYECISCSRVWDNGMRIDATIAGEWVGEVEWIWPMPVGFHINGLYSHFKTLGERASEFVDARRSREDFKTFVNTTLAESWEETGEYETSPEAVARLSERYDAPVPGGVQVLTAGIDVQADRLEVEVLGFGHGEECWSIEHKLLPGDPTGWQVWEDLHGYLGQDFRDAGDHPHYIQASCIDSGYLMQNVLAAIREYTRRRPTQRAWAIKGSVDPMVKIWPSNPQRNNMHRVPLHTINVGAIKETIMSRLKDADGGAEGHTPGLQLFHFPHTHDPDYYEQLMSERQVPRLSRGRRQRSLTGRINKEWVVKPGRRNEVLDCVVYAYAALQGWLSLGNRFAARVAPIPKAVQTKSEDAGGGGDVEPATTSLPPQATGPQPAPASSPVPQPRPAQRRAPSRGDGWMRRFW
jgi:phage terminase large subunit GpA-like protein